MTVSMVSSRFAETRFAETCFAKSRFAETHFAKSWKVHSMQLFSENIILQWNWRVWFFSTRQLHWLILFSVLFQDSVKWVCAKRVSAKWDWTVSTHFQVTHSLILVCVLKYYLPQFILSQLISKYVSKFLLHKSNVNASNTIALDKKDNGLQKNI